VMSLRSTRGHFRQEPGAQLRSFRVQFKSEEQFELEFELRSQSSVKGSWKAVQEHVRFEGFTAVTMKNGVF
jgi:hypothetical protein